MVEPLDKIKIFISPYGPPLKSVENYHFGASPGALKAGYAAPAPCSPGTRIAGGTCKKKWLRKQEVMAGLSSPFV